MDELYDYMQSEAVDEPQYPWLEILPTVNGEDYGCFYDIALASGVALTGTGTTITMPDNLFIFGTDSSYTGIVTDFDGTVVSLVVNVVDFNGDPIDEATVYIEDSDGDVLMNERTGATGVASEPYIHTADETVTIKVRKSSADPKYIPTRSTATITTQGLSVTVTMQFDPYA
jgi:hypothetical protein